MEYLGQHGWMIILVFALLGLVFVVAGLVELARAGLKLKDRVLEVADLEVIKTIDATVAKIDATQHRIGEMPVLIERAKSALLSIRASRERLQRQVQTATAVFNLARTIFTPKSH